MKDISLHTTLSDTFIGITILAFYPRHRNWQEADDQHPRHFYMGIHPPPPLPLGSIKHRTTHHFLLLLLLLPLFILFYLFLLLSIYCGYLISFIVNIPGTHDPKRAILIQDKIVAFSRLGLFRYSLEPFLPGTSWRSAPSMSAFEEKEYWTSLRGQKYYF